MFNKQVLERVREANPVALDQAQDMARAAKLSERVLSDGFLEQHPRRFIKRSGYRRRSRFLAASLTLFVALTLTLFVAPALGIAPDVIPFFGKRGAPERVQLEFESMNTGAPTGMSPAAIASETREVGEFSFAGASHTLWVSPTRQHGFCFEWTAAWGGCNPTGTSTLSWNGDLALPVGVKAPKLSSHPSTDELLRVRSLAVPGWLAGYVTLPDATGVVIHFTDGTVAKPDRLLWVSAPINAGFFSYDVPSIYRTETKHVASVEALSADGVMLAERPLDR